jgi:putative tricarboxylic transport membrane protein
MNKTFDTIAGCLFLVVGAFFVVGSRGISRSSYGSTVGPNVFPFWLGIILILLALTVITQARRSRGAAKQKGARGARDYRRFGLLLLATIVYVSVFESLGYVISTFLYLVVVFQVMERKKLLVSIGIAAFFSCFIYTVYVSVFQGTLPPLPEWLGIPGY